jgi:hypothetical protein
LRITRVRGRAEGAHPLEGLLNVPEVVDEVREDHEVERLFDRQLGCVALHEPKLGMPLLRLADHLGREIDADTVAGPQ